MRKLRQYLASALIVTMIASTASVTAWAENEPEEQKHAWYLEDGEWHYYDRNGVMFMAREKGINDKWYGFDKDGRMYSDELFSSWSIIGDEDENGESMEKRYAFPDGRLAQANTWLRLNDDDGSLHEHGGNEGDDCPAGWYFFKGDGENSGDGYPERGLMVHGKKMEVNKNFYRFHDEGRMYSREWNTDETDETEEAESFYEMEGVKARNKWLPLGSYWYHFDKDGLVTEVAQFKETNQDPMVTTASASNVPYCTVDSIKVIGEKEKKVTVGKPVNLEFQVTLASDSNAASSAFTKDHDFWLSKSRNGGYKIEDVSADGTCVVSYTTNSFREETLRLMIDGVPSDEITIIPVVKENNAADQKNATEMILTAWKNGEMEGGTSATMVRDDIKEIYQSSTAKQKLQGHFLKLQDEVKELDGSCIMENYAMTAVDVSEDAQELLGDGSVGLVGGGLNTEAGDETAGLSVEQGDAAELKETFTRKAAFDISFEAGGEIKSELELPVIVSMPLPEGFTANNLKLYHIHEGGEPEELNIRVRDGKVSFVTDSFSTFIFAQNEKKENNSDDSGYRGDSDDESSGSSNAETGHWFLNEVGWWYRNSDGTYPVNTWKQLPYNQKTDWYHFDKDGYINIGWFTDLDGHIYYLNPISNGFKGAMLTGWQEIDGKQYYFNEVSDGFKGACLTE